MAELHANDRLDKRQARRAFEQAAETYDAAAALQQEIGSRLLERMDLFTPAQVVELIEAGSVEAVLAGGYAEAGCGVDLARPWGESQSCTSCGKCVQVCPTGALFEKIRPRAEMIKSKDFLVYLKTAREKKLWIR